MTRRLVFSYLVIAAFILVVLGVPLGIFFEHQRVDGLTADLERDATVLATIYEDALEGGLPVDEVAAVEYNRRTGARVVVVDDEGISLVDTGAVIDRDLSTRPEFQEALSGRHATGRRRSETLDTELVFAAVPVASGGTVYGAVRATLDTHEVQEDARRFWLGLGAAAVVALAAVAVVGWVVARSISRPLRRLQRAADRFAAGDLATDAPRERVPELQSLERSMNTMAGELSTVIERQRRFVADASHQLRTPLTALRLRLENIEVLSQDSSNTDAAEELARALEESDRLTQLVGDLLRLATAERRAPLTTIELSSVIRDRVDTWQAIAADSAVALETVLPESPVAAAATAGALEQILDNLLDNAIRAAPAGSTVTITVEPRSNHVRILVADQGEGLPDEDKEKALERFWRADPAGEGTGLGLSIVTQLVRAAGGTVRLSDAFPHGLVVEFTLSRAAGAHG